MQIKIKGDERKIQFTKPEIDTLVKASKLCRALACVVPIDDVASGLDQIISTYGHNGDNK